MYAVSWNGFDMSKQVKSFLILLLFLAVLSWEDAAQDQHRRMHGDDDAGGAGCSMHIDWESMN